MCQGNAQASTMCMHSPCASIPAIKDMDRQGTLGEVASPLEASQPQASHQPKNDETQVPPGDKATAPPVGMDIASSIAHMQALFAKKPAAAAGAAMKRPAAAAGGAQKRKAIADSDVQAIAASPGIPKVSTKGLVIPFPGQPKKACEAIHYNDYRVFTDMKLGCWRVVCKGEINI